MDDSNGMSETDRLLDDWFEYAVARLEAGREPSLDAWLSSTCASTADSGAIDRDSAVHAAARRLLEVARSIAFGGVAPSSDESKRAIHGYTLVRELGRGSMGSVWLARQERLGGRPVALKILPRALALTEGARARFRDEAMSIARLRHPNIVTVHDVIEDGETLAFAMELIDGPSLADEIKQAAQSGPPAGPPPRHAPHARGRTAAIVGVGIDIARALGAVHSSGLVHRDVKPSNILLRRTGVALLADFGLVVDEASRRERTAVGFVGTLAYAAPEQIRRHAAGNSETPQIGPSADLFALGATLFHALAMRPPFEGPRGVDDAAPPLRSLRPDLPRDLETIVATAMELDPLRRYRSADAMAEDLERLLRLEPIVARPPGPLRLVAKAIRRHRRAVAHFVTGAVVAIVIAAASGVAAVTVPSRAARLVSEARGLLLDAIDSRHFYSTIFWSLSDQERRDGEIGIPIATLLAARDRYDAALRWWGAPAGARAEQQVIEARLAQAGLGGTAANGRPDDLRSRGLAALIEGRYETALKAWSELERDEPANITADPLVTAATGMLHLIDGEVGRAYPRLLAACEQFPDNGSLDIALAEAALRCGDLAVSQRALARAARARPDDRGLLRVRAGILAASGDEAGAEALYRRLLASPVATTELAELLERQGRYLEAASVARGALASAPRSKRSGAVLARCLIAWWDAASASDRFGVLASMLRLDSAASAPHLDLMREFARVELDTASPTPSPIAPVRSISAPLRWRNPAPLLERVSLSEAARLMEVRDMAQWNRLLSSPRWVRLLELMSLARGTRSTFARMWSPVVEQGRLPAAAAVLFGLTSGATAGGTRSIFVGLGDLPGGAFESRASALKALSSDGARVVGWSQTAEGPRAFLWSSAAGMVPIGALRDGDGDNEAFSIAPDGGTIVGPSAWAASSCVDQKQGFRWTEEEGIVGLGDLPGGCAYSSATAVSEGGQRIAGVSIDGSGVYAAAYWDSLLGWVRIGPDWYTSSFTAISTNGSVMAGARGVGANERMMIRWTGGPIEELGDLPGGPVDSYTFAVSSDGSAQVGYGRSEIGFRAVRWTTAGGLVELPRLDDTHDGAGAALGISPDGTIIVGSETTQRGPEAVIWLGSEPPLRIVDFLAAAQVLVPEGWLLAEATDIAVDCDVLTIVGNGTNPKGQTEAWLARAPIGAPCPADITCDRVVDGADLAVLLGSWGACLDCLADFDESGVVDGADLAILLGSWGACP